MFRKISIAWQFVAVVALMCSAITSGVFSPRVAAQESSPAAANSTVYPLTVKNCGLDLTLNAPPRRVVVMEAAAVSILDSIDSLDSVVARIGVYPPDYFSDDVNAKIAQIPELVSEQSSTGGAAISLEKVLDVNPDLVIGYETESITRDALARFGIGLYVLPPFCTDPPLPSFESIYAEVRLYGQMFDRVDAAEAAATALEQKVDSIAANPVAHGEKAAALYVSSDGSAIYAYSQLGMVHVEMTSLGLDNIYADLPDRVPEVNIESLIDGNPEVLILLYSDPSKTPEEITSLVTGLPGAEAISAIQNGRVYPLLFNYAEPPSPLAVDGLAILQQLLAQ